MEAPAAPRSSRRAWIVVAGLGLTLVLVLLFALPRGPRPAGGDADERFTAALDAPATVTAGERVVVEAVDVPLDETSALLTTLRLDLDDADGPGTFTAELDDDAVQLLVGTVGRIPLTDVELRGGFARLVFAGFPVVDATAEVEGGVVQLRPTTPLVGERVAVHVDLSGLPLGLEPSEAEIRRGVLVVTGSVPDLVSYLDRPG